MHIKNIYKDGELQEEATCKNYLQVQNEGAKVRKDDVTVAKNYLNQDEISNLNGTVTM